MKRTLLAVYDAMWLPLLLIVGTTWLFAPWLHHDYVEHLQVISVYEGTNAPFAWLFRAGDVLGGIIIVLTIWRSQLLRRQRWLGWALLAVAFLAVIDDTFVIGCYHQCSNWAVISHHIHDIESTVSLVVLAVATAIDALRSKQNLSRLFLAAQLLAGFLIVASIIDKQAADFIQYLYQTVTIVWIAYVLRRYVPPPVWHWNSRLARLGIASLLFVGGLLEITQALHGTGHHQLAASVWLAQHGVLVGATMLYLSRQMYRGQRRAAFIIVAVLISQAIKYALFTPHLLPLLFTEFMLVAMWLYWPAFNRNLGVPPIVSRLKSLALLFAGTVAAIVVLFVFASLVGQQHRLAYEARHLFTASNVSLRRTEGREDYLERRLSRIRYVTASLGVVLLGFTVFTIFKPANDFETKRLLEQSDVERLLQLYSNSSEDFFKLWPEDKSYFTVPGIDGCIAYKKVGSTMFSLADPICDPMHRAELLRAFMESCHAYGWAVCFLMVTPDSRDLYTRAGLKTINIGSSAVVPVKTFSLETVRDKWWRWQLNRAKKAGTTYQVAQPPHSLAVLDETAAVSSAWLERAGHKEQGFVLGYYSNSYMQRCRLHLLRDENGRLIAFANQLPSYHESRQTTVDLIRFRPDFNGAMPVLIANLIQGLAEQSAYDTFDLGFVPLAKIDTRAATIAKRLSAGRFSAAGLEQFKGKFNPDWQSQYLAYDGDLIDLTVFIARLERALQK